MARSMGRPRGYDRTGGAPWVAKAGVLTILLGATFALGVAVGRYWAPHGEEGRAAVAPDPRPAAAVARRGGLTEPAPGRPPEEKLTFYQTLTAPMTTFPPRDEVTAPPKPEPIRPLPVAERASGDRPVAATPVPDKPARPAERPTASRVAEARPGDWVVQVGVFRDRTLAEGVRRPLAASGFDAYLTAVPTADGQTQYKVRMGRFKTRHEATRMAERVRQERSLATFVTSQ